MADSQRDSSLADAVEALLRRCRDERQRPGRQEIDKLYTDGCAGALTLEAERLRVKRRLAATLADSKHDADAAREARELADRQRDLDRELSKLSRLVRDLKVAAEWMREPDAADLPGSDNGSNAA